MHFEIRDVVTSDLAAILELNESVIPAVNSLTLEDLHWFLRHAFYFRLLTDTTGLGGFLIGLRPGTDYGSLNYQWFSQRYDDFAYVDRVAVSPRARRLGLASMLYDDFRAAVPDNVQAMTCEVNLRPPNDGSLRYHQQRGFRQVGSQETEGGSKEVALMLLDLTSSD